MLADGDRTTAVLHFAAKALVGESVERPRAVLAHQRRRHAWRCWTRCGRNGGAAAGVLLHRRHVRGAGGGADRGVGADPADQPVRGDQAGRGHDDRLRGPGSRVGRGQPALLQRGRRVRAGTHGERHDPETHIIPIALQVAAGLRPACSVYGTDYPTPDGTCIRDYIHVRRPGRRPPAGAGPDRQPTGEHRICNLGNGAGFSVLDVVEAVRRVTGHPMPTEVGRPGGRATRPCWSPPARGPRASWAGCRSRGGRDGRRRLEVLQPGIGADRCAEAPGVAPGRVNLIGEHTDYNDGFCCRWRCRHGCTATVSPLDEPVLEMRSVQRGEPVEIAVADLRPGR